MIARFRVDELDVDPHAVAAALNAALEDIADVQLAPDRLRVDRLESFADVSLGFFTATDESLTPPDKGVRLGEIDGFLSVGLISASLGVRPPLAAASAAPPAAAASVRARPERSGMPAAAAPDDDHWPPRPP
jgi:hypothetical protein